jgi:hypothetical protein
MSSTCVRKWAGTRKPNPVSRIVGFLTALALHAQAPSPLHSTKSAGLKPARSDQAQAPPRLLAAKAMSNIEKLSAIRCPPVTTAAAQKPATAEDVLSACLAFGQVFFFRVEASSSAFDREGEAAAAAAAAKERAAGELRDSKGRCRRAWPLVTPGLGRSPVLRRTDRNLHSPTQHVDGRARDR